MLCKKEIESSANNAVSSTLQCDGKAVGSVEKLNIVAGQSTPSKHDLSTQQDLLNLDYHSSLCTQTQDGGVEVTWDWHSPGRKAVGNNGKNIKTHEAHGSSTPKRTTIIHKKRISNSPMMYKPLKRKLIKKENTDDIDKFKAELIALSEKIRNAQEDEKFSSNGLDDIAKIDIPGEIEFDDFSDDESDVVSINNEVQSLIGHGGKENKNFEDLFDDSLNDTMIKCSQEIEERLNIAPVKSKQKNNDNTVTADGDRNFLVRKNSDSSSININENKLISNLDTKKSNVNVQSLEFEVTKTREFIKKNQKLNSITPKRLMPSSKSLMTSGKITNHNVTNIKSQQSSLIPNDIKINLNSQELDEFSIPDDSFDEFLTTCEEDFSQSDINQTSMNYSRYGKVYDNLYSISSKKSISTSPKIMSKSSSSSLLKALSNDSKGTAVKTNIATKNNNIGNSIIQSSKTTPLDSHSTSTANRNWKFFKSKSHSDSSTVSNDCNNVRSSSKQVNQTNLGNVFRGGSNSNLNIKDNSRVSSSSSVSTEHEISSIHRTTSCLDSNTMTRKTIQTTNTHNTQMLYHVNRCAAKEDGNNGRTQNSGDVMSVIQSLQICGPEEIKRKRMEAKMKLEAKKKREKMRGNSGVSLS